MALMRGVKFGASGSKQRGFAALRRSSRPQESVVDRVGLVAVRDDQVALPSARTGA
jgi:hypothetical protein